MPTLTVYTQLATVLLDAAPGSPPTFAWASSGGSLHYDFADTGSASPFKPSPAQGTGTGTATPGDTTGQSWDLFANLSRAPDGTDYVLTVSVAGSPVATATVSVASGVVGGSGGGTTPADPPFFAFALTSPASTPPLWSAPGAGSGACEPAPGDTTGIFWVVPADASALPDGTYPLTLTLSGVPLYETPPTVTVAGGVVVATTGGGGAAVDPGGPVPAGCVWGGVYGGTAGPWGNVYGPWVPPVPLPDTLLEAIHEAFDEDARITALVGTRHYTGTIMRGDPLPVVSATRLVFPADYTMGPETAGYGDVEVQFSCFDADEQAAEGLADSIRGYVERRDRPRLKWDQGTEMFAKVLGGPTMTDIYGDDQRQAWNSVLRVRFAVSGRP